MAAATPKDSISRFTIEGKPYEIDLANLKWGEIEELEDYFRCSYEAIDFTSAKATMFTAFLAVRRKKPSTTLDDIRALAAPDIQGREADTSKPPSTRKSAAKSRTRSPAKAAA